MINKPIVLTTNEVQSLLSGELKHLLRKGEGRNPVAQDENGWYRQVPIREGALTFMDREYVPCPIGEVGQSFWVAEDIAKGRYVADNQSVNVASTVGIIACWEQFEGLDTIPASAMPWFASRFILTIDAVKVIWRDDKWFWQIAVSQYE